MIYSLDDNNLANINLLKVNDRITRTSCEICSQVNNKNTRATSVTSLWCLIASIRLLIENNHLDIYSNRSKINVYYTNCRLRTHLHETRGKLKTI